jgi:hypothetical protein
LKAQDRYLPSF